MTQLGVRHKSESGIMNNWRKRRKSIIMRYLTNKAKNKVHFFFISLNLIFFHYEFYYLADFLEE